MKRLFMMGVLAVFFGLMSGSVFAIGYGTDFLEPGNAGGIGSLKTFDDSWTMRTTETIQMDIWLNDLPESLISAGCLINFDPAVVSIVSFEAYDNNNLPGPWDEAATKLVIVPELGTIMLLLQLSCANPDSDADIILARITFRCQAPSAADIIISTVDDTFDTVVGCNSATIYDPQIVPKTITIQQTPKPCVLNSDCDDGLFCNGTETCMSNICQVGINPCAPALVCDESNDVCVEPPCSVSVIPAYTTVYAWESFQFSAPVDGACNDPCFTWEISSQESTGSTINQNGLYTAGGNAGIDIVQLTDPCNGNISANAKVDVIASTTTTTIIPTTTTTAPPGKPDKDKYNFRGAGANMNMYACSGCVCSSVYFDVSESMQKDSPGAPVRYGPSGYLYLDSYNECTGGYRSGDAEIELNTFDISQKLDSAFAEGSGTIYGWGMGDYDDTTGRPFTESVSIQVTWTGIGDLYSGKYKYSDNYNYLGFSVRYSYQGSGSSRDAQATGSILVETNTIGIVSDYASMMQATERIMGVEKYSKDVLYRSHNYCEGNFDGDQDVDGNDATKFKSDFGRSKFNNPCPQF